MTEQTCIFTSHILIQTGIDWRHREILIGNTQINRYRLIEREENNAMVFRQKTKSKTNNTQTNSRKKHLLQINILATSQEYNSLYDYLETEYKCSKTLYKTKIILTQVENHLHFLIKCKHKSVNKCIPITLLCFRSYQHHDVAFGPFLWVKQKNNLRNHTETKIQSIYQDINVFVKYLTQRILQGTEYKNVFKYKCREFMVSHCQILIQIISNKMQCASKHTF